MQVGLPGEIAARAAAGIDGYGVGRYATAESPAWARAGGWRRALLSNSLGAVMGVIFLLSWLAQSISAFNEQRLSELRAPVASMVVLAIFLRQRGSPESKPVGAAHGATGVEG